MPGLLALILVTAVIFLIIFSEQQQKKNLSGIFGQITEEKNIIYSCMATLCVATQSVKGYLALTEDGIYFLTANKKDKPKLQLQLKYSDIISHKLYFSIFIEAMNHTVYEIKSANNAMTYNAFVKQYAKSTAAS